MNQIQRDLVFDLFKENSRIFFSSMCEEGDIQLYNLMKMPNFEDFWFSMITLHSFNDKMLFKVFFKNKIEPQALFSEDAFNLYEKLCQMVIGTVKTGLGKCGIDSGISLPYTTRGFANIWSKADETEFNHYHWWCLESNEQQVICFLGCDLKSDFDTRIFKKHLLNFAI
ncbi:MAG: hypothetical protein CMP10_19505 [Zetaproteobacteria bacterium]|nr:hypothetical protein [Pseudobdellovibrionaceae bacterium]